jgi:nucleotide-binding universal stress UspA family protein
MAHDREAAGRTPVRVGPDGTRHDVVVGTDGSPADGQAVAWASREVRLRGGDAGLLTVQGLSVPDLLHVSAEAAMLVLGPPRGALTPHLPGPGTTSLLARATSPVVVVRGPDPDSPAQHWKPLVVGVDTHHQDPAVVAFAAREAWLRRVPLRVVTAWSLPTRAGAGVAHFQGGALAEWAGRLANEARGVAAQALARAQAASPGLVVTTEVVEKPAAEALIACSRAAQLVVVGGAAGRRTGPTSRGLLHHSSCPLAVATAPPVPG